METNLYMQYYLLSVSVFSFDTIFPSAFNFTPDTILCGHIAEYTLSIRPDDEDLKTSSATTCEH